MTPEKFDLDLGDNHWLQFIAYQDDPRTGGAQHHLKADGTMCGGWVAFEGGAWARAFDHTITTWKVECVDPLTLSPSLLCRGCGDHGFIRAGRWVRA